MSDFKLGEHDAMIRTLDRRTAEMAKDIAEIKDLLAEQAGARKTLAKVATLSSAITVAVVKVGGLVVAALRHA